MQGNNYIFEEQPGFDEVHLPIDSHRGMRAVVQYVVQRTDVRIFSPEREIDPAYGKALDEAVRQGVEF